LVGPADGAEEVLELLDEREVTRAGAAGPGEGQELAVGGDQAAAAEDAARVQLEGGGLVAGGGPGWGARGGPGLAGGHARQRGRLPRAGVEHPGDAVGASLRVADDAAAPTLARHAGLGAAAGEEQFGALLGDGVLRAGLRLRGRRGRADDARAGGVA